MYCCRLDFLRVWSTNEDYRNAIDPHGGSAGFSEKRGCTREGHHCKGHYLTTVLLLCLTTLVRTVHGTERGLFYLPSSEVGVGAGEGAGEGAGAGAGEGAGEGAEAGAGEGAGVPVEFHVHVAKWFRRVVRTCRRWKGGAEKEDR